MRFRGFLPSIPVKYLVPFLVALLALDSIVKELLDKISGLDSSLVKQIKGDSFYILPPLLVVGSILLVPYARSRLAIVSPRSVTNSLLIIMVGVTLFTAAMLGIIYYQQSPYDGHDAKAINSSALLVKDVILTASIGAFSLRGVRLLQWYRRIRNFVVLAFALSSFGVVSFAAFHIVKDYVVSSRSVANATIASAPPTCTSLNECLVSNGMATSFIAFVLLTHIGLILVLRAYFGGLSWLKFTGVLLSSPALFIPNLIRVGVPQLHWDVHPPLLWILIFGFIMAGPVQLWGWYLLVPLFTNPAARDYSRTFAYSYGLFSGSTCGMGLTLLITFPLLGYASFFAFFASAALSFAAFTSLASYFSITEDVRRQIRESTGFFTAIGEAEKGMATERQLSGLYDRFSELAKASGALEEGAFTREEIQSYIASLKKANEP